MAVSGGIAMDDLLLLSKAQMRRIEPYFPLSHGIARVDDRRVISGIVIRNGLRWRDAPAGYGPHKTIYNRFVRWSASASSTRSSPNWRARPANRPG
jgi:transposase